MSQRSMVAARLATLSGGRPSKNTPPIGGVSAASAAKQLNVGERSVKRARQVLEHGSPELVISCQEITQAPLNFPHLRMDPHAQEITL